MVETKTTQKPEAAIDVLTNTSTPTLSKVIIFNDDFTPMEFVVEVLERVFWLNEAQATSIMMQAHYDGKATLGFYPKDIAETKAYQLNTEARQNGHPLLCEVADN